MIREFVDILEFKLSPDAESHDSTVWGERRGNVDRILGAKGRVRPEDDTQYRRISANSFIIDCRPESSLCIPFNTVSGQHAEITIDGDQLVMRDEDSTNGTYVDGAPGSSGLLLKESDLIQFANVAFRVRCEMVEVQRNATVSNSGVYDLAFSLKKFDRLHGSRSGRPILSTAGNFSRTKDDWLRSPRPQQSIRSENAVRYVCGHVPAELRGRIELSVPNTQRRERMFVSRDA